MDAILVDTAEIGAAGAGLTNINLPNQTMDITGNLSGSVGSVTGAVGSVTGAVGSVAGNVDGNVTGSVGSLAAQAKLDVNAEADTALSDYDPPTKAEMDTAHGLLATPAQVNAEVLDVLNVDTFAQPGQETPAATNTIRAMLAYLYKAWRNRITSTATQYNLYNDDATTIDQKATLSDDATTADKTEITTGP